MIKNGVNPDHAVGFLNKQTLGTNLAQTMGLWLAEHADAPWSAFKQAFLQMNPGKPPQVTRLTWKSLSMKSSGNYHSYLQEFNRQRALIHTGPDEVIEQFLLGLSATLRTQMEFLKNRNWQSHEFAELVNATTERVNSTTASATKDATQNITSGSSTYPKRARTDHPNKHAGPSKKAQAQQTAAGAKPKFVGKTPGETSAITQYCYEKGLCKFCKGRHHYSTCRTKEIKDSPILLAGMSLSGSTGATPAQTPERRQKTLSSSSTTGPVCY